MKVLRNIFAVIIGYLIFVVSAVLLFGLSGIDPHAEAGPMNLALVIICGCIFSFLGGYVCKIIANSRSLTPNIALFLLMAGFAAFSLFRSEGNHYTQIAAIFLFSPLSLLGGFLRQCSEKN